MADINTIIEEAQLMKQNRADLVKALNDVGFSQVNDSTPLSSIAKYMQWAGGLLDLRLACFHKTTKEHRYFTREEWEGLSASNKSSYIKMGICIRAERQQFIIAKDNATTASGSLTMTWAPNNSNNVRGLTDFYNISTLLADIDGEANTDLILAAVETNGIDYPAAQRARAYKASTVADGGVDDPNTWSLPAIGQLWLLYKYFVRINEEMTFYGMSTIINDWHWSSTECNSSYAWTVTMTNGDVPNSIKTSATRVRPVAPVSESAAASAI